MIRRKLNWKALLLASGCILALCIILLRFVFPSWLPSAKQLPTGTIVPTSKTTPTGVPTIMAFHLNPQAITPTATPTVAASKLLSRSLRGPQHVRSDKMAGELCPGL